MNIKEKIREAGIVGAGGAGFPTHVKASSGAECVIANGAECEPLIHKDYEIMMRYPGKVINGLQLLMESTGAKRGIVGVKKKNKPAVEALTSAIHGSHVTIHLLEDFYPSGDEYTLVYEATGRSVPPLGIPPDIGIVVCNVETLYNIFNASEGSAVTDKFITVSGAVNRSGSFFAPVGTSYKDLIEAAGGFMPGGSGEYGVFAGGVMMGRLEFDLSRPITKTTAGLVVLPGDHPVVARKNRTLKSMDRIGRSACDQCSYCTELCPRYILGYDVQPHKVMRSLGFTLTGEEIWNQYASLCCACGLCTLYACPENLYPKEACDKAKTDLQKNGIRWSGAKNVTPHPMYAGRRTPAKQLMRRLGVTEYDLPSEFFNVELQPRKVDISLSQHMGVPAAALVKKGQNVRKGECIGEIPEGKLGARVHASIEGIVKSAGDSIIIESV